MVISRKIMMEILPYLNISMTEEITDELLTELELTWDDVQGGRNAVLQKEKQQAESEAIENGTLETDEYGNVIDSSSETDAYGNPISGATETDAYGNPIGEQGAVSNPNVPAPPEDNGENTAESSQNSVTNEQLGIDTYGNGQW